ncbi:MAG TPA: acetyl-CoA C-acyltransferase [Spirochaetota bacterium]|nr:acetyl-CoA C-acyltransferase [Spirochaetota bacterium]
MAKGDRIAIIDGCRTPFLRSGAAYREMMAYAICRHAVKGLVAKTGIPNDMVDHVIMGSVLTDVKTTNVAREIMLAAALPNTIPAYTCTVACISANAAIISAANLIVNGNADCIIAGGVETFSDPDIKISKNYRRFIMDLTMFKRPKTVVGKLKLLKGMSFKDFIVPEQPEIGEFSTQLRMGDTADRLAKRLGISQGNQDAFAALSHNRAAAAWEKGILKKEVVPVVTPQGRLVDKDNGFRKGVTPEKLAALKPAFDKRYGTVTAGNSSFLTDGGAAVLLMSETLAKKMRLKPLAYIKSYAFTAQDLWEELLLGPVFSIPKALAMGKLKFKDIGVWEIHEAFGVQMVAVVQLLASDSFCKNRLGLSGKLGEIKLDNLNIYGGSLSLGHPFGATGARLVTTCANRLRESGKRYGVVAGCAAGAVGNAIILERS